MVNYKLKGNYVPLWVYKEKNIYFPTKLDTYKEFSKSLNNATQILTLFREGNEISIGDPRQDIINYTAKSLSASVRDKYFIKTKINRRTLKQRVKGGLSLMKIKHRELVGLPVVVTYEEAEKNASICSTCNKREKFNYNSLEVLENNVFSLALEKHGKLNQARELEMKYNQKKDDNGGYPYSLMSCSICSCLNANTIFFNKQIFAGDKDKYPDHCWKK